MGSAMEIGIKIRKTVFISIREVYRSACHHPFLVGFFGFLFLLYRCFPFLFSVLISASPVLVCTALLLGTLLSFGQPNLPEFEKEEKVTHGISSFQIGFSEGETVLSDRDESYFVKGYSEHRSDIEESGIEEVNLVGEKDDRTEEDRGLLYDDGENLQDIQPEKQVQEEVEREFHSFELGKSREVHEENLISEVVSSDDEAIEKQYVLVQQADDDFQDVENEKTREDEFESFKEGDVNGSPSSSWKQVENNDDDEDESMESGSDKAESSSPDASMADIMPMLDELHPLLDIDAPQPTHISRDGSSDSASEMSQKSDDDSGESDEDIENQGEAEDGVDEEEEEMEGGKEDESKSAIKWTEDDQKNLIDLGTLELERNRRLENLIARRRARRMMVEKNLIDFDSADIPCNVAPISVRRNPFDFPDESYAAMGLPPIPGSAPSILQPRRNPFDIPYDPNEEKPDLKGDSFQQEFTEFTQKDPLFRRHESFSMGPSVLGIPKQERHDFNWKPVFISERMASEGTSYFHRQSSEVSDSKLSSVPDTESVSSADQDERKFSEHDLSPENELTSNMDHASDDADHGSVYSGENDSVEMIQVEESNVLHDEVEIVLGLGSGMEDPSEMEFYPATGELEIHEQFNEGETRLQREPSVEVSSSSSSHTSLSEVIDNIPGEELEKTANMHQEDGHLPESRISLQASMEESNFHHVSGELEEHQHVEPVYDSSPPAGEKLQSFLSVSSDSATEYSDSVLPPVSVETTADVADKESEVHSQRLKDYSSGHEKNQEASSELHVEVKNESGSEKSEDKDHHNVIADELSAVVSNFVDQNGSAMADFEVVPISVDSNFSSDIGSEKDVTYSGLVHKRDLATQVSSDSEMLHQDNVDSPDSNYQLASEKSHLSDNESMEEVELPNEVSRFDNEDVSVSVQDADEMLDAVASDADERPSNGSSMHAVEDLQFSPTAGQAPIVHLPSEETEHIERISSNEEHIFPIEQDKVSVSSSVEQDNTVHQDLDKNMVSFTSDNPHEIDVKSPSNFESHLSSSGELVAAQSSYDHDEIQNSDDIHVGPAQGVGTSNNGVEELHDTINEISVNNSTVASEKFDTPEFGSPTGEVDSEGYKHGGEVEDESENEAHEFLFPSADGFMTPLTGEHINEFFYMKEIDEEIGREVEYENENEAHQNSVPSGEGFMSPLAGEHINEFYYKNEFGGEVEDENQNEAHQNLVPSAEGYMSPLTEEHINEFDFMKEYDEEFFSELDTVGDFSVGDASVSLHTDIMHEETRDAQHSSLPEDVKTAEVEQDIPVLEARSLEDINLAFKQLQEGVDVEDVILPSSVKDQLVREESKDYVEDDSHLRVIEARSREDIDVALKNYSENIDVGEEPDNSDVEDNSDLQVIEARSLEDIDVGEEPKDYVEVNSNLQVTEARSLEDNDVALQKKSENIDVSEEPKDHVEVNSDPQVTEARSLEDIDVALQKNSEKIDVSEESKHHVEVNSDLHATEDRSPKDIDVALQQNSEDNQGEQPKKLDSKDASVKIEANETGSTKVNESVDVATNAKDISKIPIDKPENVSITSSSPKEKSHSKKSSSSSSSSDSD